jgi:hypothetical protein
MREIFFHKTVCVDSVHQSEKKKFQNAQQIHMRHNQIIIIKLLLFIRYRTIICNKYYHAPSCTSAGRPKNEKNVASPKDK